MAMKRGEHPLDRYGRLEWKPAYFGESKPVVLLTEVEIMSRFPARDAADVITARNVARDLAEALARASGRFRDTGRIAASSIRTRFDGGAFRGVLRSPFQVALWFENNSPLADEATYPRFTKIYDLAEKNLSRFGEYRTQREPYDASMTIWYLQPSDAGMVSGRHLGSDERDFERIDRAAVGIRGAVKRLRKRDVGVR